MKAEETVTVSVSGEDVLDVSVMPGTPRSYVGETVLVDVVVGPPDLLAGPFDVTVDWGDGTVESYSETFPGDEANPWVYYHKYNAAGSYTIKVSVMDEGTGASGSGSALQDVKAPLSVDLSASPTSGVLPLEVAFTCTALGGYLDYSWTLDPGDGSAPYGGTRTAEGSWTVKHTYSRAGTFTAKLTVTDALGETLTREVRLGAGVPPVPVEAPLLPILCPLAAGLVGFILSKLA